MRSIAKKVTVNGSLGPFTRTVTITVKVYYCANGNRLFDVQNGFQMQSVHQTVRHHLHNDKL